MVRNQAYLFLIFIINGILIGLLFDFFRILRKSFKTKDFITYIEDIIFWILAGFLVLYSIFTFNNGEIRLFIFLGLALGISIYLLTISKYIMKISVEIIRWIKKIISQILKIFTYPFMFIIKIVKKVVIKLIQPLNNKITIHFDNINQKVKKKSLNIKTNVENFKKIKNKIKK